MCPDGSSETEVQNFDRRAATIEHLHDRGSTPDRPSTMTSAATAASLPRSAVELHQELALEAMEAKIAGLAQETKAFLARESSLPEVPGTPPLRAKGALLKIGSYMSPRLFLTRSWSPSRSFARRCFDSHCRLSFSFSL